MIATIALDYHPLTNTSSVAVAASISPLGLERQRGGTANGGTPKNHERKQSSANTRPTHI